MLEADKPAKGLVFSGLSDAQRQKLMELTYEKAGCRIKPNALRHSFGSYHLVAFQKPEVTATEMGHVSPTQTFTAYRKAVLKSQGEEYWKIRTEAKAWVKGKPKAKAKAKATPATVAEIIPAEKLLAA
jgi:integrase